MNSFATIHDARIYAADHPAATYILEIVPGAPGINRYICTRADAATMRRSLASKPMSEITAIVGDAVHLEGERWAAQEARIAHAIPGLAELRAAIADEDRYHEAFERMMEDEYNDGARPPKPVQISSAEVGLRYPIAAAYIKAEAWECAAHYAKSAAGKRAKQRLEAGEPYQQVIAEMEAEWDQHVNAHVWD